jgi:hypothetical protein
LLRYLKVPLLAEIQSQFWFFSTSIILRLVFLLLNLDLSPVFLFL